MMIRGVFELVGANAHCGCPPNVSLSSLLPGYQPSLLILLQSPTSA
jgi:hypothetical protein